MMRKHTLLLAILSFTLAAFSAPKRPNIVIMYVDDLDFDQISVYNHKEFPSYTGAMETGNLKPLSPVTASQNGRFLKVGEMSWFKDPRMLTPNVEKLASKGVRLDRFYLTSSTCTPSRYSLLTGRYASRAPIIVEKTPSSEAPIIAWNSFLDPDESNLAKDLKAVGYKTAMIGKWHLSDYDTEGIDFSTGFENHHAEAGTGGNLRPFQLAASYFPPTADYGDPGVQREVARVYEAMRQQVQKVSGFDVVDRLYFANIGGIPLPEHMRVHNLEWLTEGALDFIDKNKDQPFFLYFSLTAPHGQYFEDWMQKDWRATPAGMLKKRPQGMPSRESVRRRVLAEGLPLQNAMATWIDDSLGAVLSKLEETGVADNTIILFLSDHQSRGKLTVYEGNHAPGIISWPGHVKSGSVEKRIVSNIDLYPTLMEVAGARIDPETVIDGKSMVPLLKGMKIDNWRDSLLLETSYSRAVVTNNWKYMAHRPPADVLKSMAADLENPQFDDGRRHVGWSGRTTGAVSGMGVRFNADQDFPTYFDPDQLFNLEQDVFEQQNLISDPEHKEVLKSLKKKLDQHIQSLPHSFGEFGRE